MVQYCIDNNVSVVTGNHELMMIKEAIEEANHFNEIGEFNWRGAYDYNSHMGDRNIWGINGGYNTLESYFKKDHKIDMDKLNEHIEWMKKLPMYLEYKDVKNEKGQHLLITHSSAAKVWKWSEDCRKLYKEHFVNHIAWGRPNNINPIPDIYNIFGHTPIVNGPRVKQHYANIDTGCFFDAKPGYFKLTAIQFPGLEIYRQDNIDKEKVYEY